MTDTQKKSAVNDLAFTGERFIPQATDPVLALEHYHRYLYASTLVKGKHVLDIACGEGYGAAFLSLNAKQVLGIDNDERTIAHAKETYRKYSNLQFQTGRCEDFSLTDKPNAIVSFETLEHIDESAQNKFLGNIKKSLSDGGMLIISTPDRKIYGETREGKNEFHKHEFTAGELTEFLKKYFKHVLLVGQRPVTLSAIWTLQRWSNGNFRFEPRTDLLNAPAKPEEFTAPMYLIAICSDTEIAREVEEQTNSFYYDVAQVERVHEILAWARRLDEELTGVKQFTVRLQKEFEERSLWANKLVEENSAFGKRVGELQKENEEKTMWALRLDKEITLGREQFAKLQKEFEERSTWANKINTELGERGEYLTKLQKEFEERSAWALSLSDEVKSLRGKIEEIDQKYVESERKSREMQVWGEMLERQLNHITMSPVYRLLAAIGLLPKRGG